MLEVTFDIERARFGKSARAAPIGPPLFVMGLARGGTSILTRMLHESGHFASLTYADMPFPLAPNSWARMAGASRRSLASRPRSHGDGLEHDLDTPEAIEEVFWRCFEGRRFSSQAGLRVSNPAEETIGLFRDFMALVCLRYRCSRYLSKNNNNILRLDAVRQSVAGALLVHPFRAPEQQAASLLNQHRRALALHQQNPFHRHYMTWLGHHEFGSGVRPFLLPEDPAAGLDRSDPNHWLSLWLGVYRHLLDQPPHTGSQQLFFDYDQACLRPLDAARELARHVAAPLRLDLRAAAKHETTAFDPVLLAKAHEVHRELRKKAING